MWAVHRWCRHRLKSWARKLRKRGHGRPSDERDQVTENLTGCLSKGVSASAVPRVGGLARLLPLDQINTATVASQVRGTFLGSADRSTAVHQARIGAPNLRQSGHNSYMLVRGPAARERRYASTICTPSGIRATVCGVSSRAVPYSHVAFSSSREPKIRHQRSGR